MANRNRRMLSRAEVSVTREIAYIVGKARERDCRVVSLGNLVLFSTETGDAWMLDPEDGLALCLACDGSKQDYRVHETAANFQIEWNAQYRIEQGVFTVATRDGRVRSITGYPTEEIQRSTKGRSRGRSPVARQAQDARREARPT